MKKEFTKEEMIAKKGCYSIEQLNACSFMKKDIVNLIDILNSEISIKDKRWFLWNKCDIILEQEKKLSLQLAWIVLPIYQSKYPNDNRVKDCLQAIEDFYSNKINIDELIIKRNDAYAAYTATTAAAYAAAYAANAAYAAYTAANAAAYAANAAAYAANAAYAAANADNATEAKSLTYSQQIQQALIDFVINN